MNFGQTISILIALAVIIIYVSRKIYSKYCKRVVID